MRNVLRVAVLLAAMLPLVLAPTSAAQNSFVERRQQQIEEKKQEIEEEQRALEELRHQALFAVEELDVTNAQIEEVDSRLQQINAWIAAAETRLSAVELSRAAAQEQVDAYQQQAAELEAEIAAIREQLEAQVIEIYLDLAYEPDFLLEDGDPNRNARRQFYIEELGGDAQVLIDRLRRGLDDHQAAVEQAQQAEIEIEQAEIEIEQTLVDLAELKQAQEKLQEEWIRKLQELEELVATEAETSLAIENEIAGLSQDIEAIEDEIERERERLRIEEERRRREAELARLAELERQRQNDLSRLTELDGLDDFEDASFSSPPAFFRPTAAAAGSPYGLRIHPIFGTERFHYGLDFHNNMGDDINAAASGTVTQARYRDGYGNTVVIDHGGGWSTLYAHLSRFNVSRGQQVSIGDVIGYAGSTGWSTGPHLHFEVRYKGSPRDPALYINF